jgi:hypothetical protein
MSSLWLIILMFFEEDLYKITFLDYWNNINNLFFNFYKHYMDKIKVNILPVTNIFIYYDQSVKIHKIFIK